MGAIVKKLEFNECVNSPGIDKLLRYFNNYKEQLPDPYIIDIIKAGRVDLMIEIINHKRYNPSIRAYILTEDLGSNFNIVKQMLAVDRL